MNTESPVSFTRRGALKLAACSLLSVACRNVAIADTAPTAVNAQIFGVKADGKSNDTIALQRAIDSSVGNVLVITGSPRIDTQGLTVRSGTKIRFAKGAVIKLLPHNTYEYQMFRIWDVSDVEIAGLSVDGSKELNSAKDDPKKNGYGMGISIAGASNITLSNPVTSNCWGDGIYIANSYKDAGLVTSGLTVQSHHAKGCRRQGVSLVSGRNVRFTDPVWEDIRGTLPSAGLDIEPNSNRDLLEEILISNPVTRNCRAGIEIWLANISGLAAKNIDIEISGHQDDSSDNAYIVSELKSHGHTVQGRIISRNPRWTNTKGAPYISQGMDAPNVKVQVER